MPAHWQRLCRTVAVVVRWRWQLWPAHRGGGGCGRPHYIGRWIWLARASTWPRRCVPAGLAAAYRRRCIDPPDSPVVCQVYVWLAGKERAREQDMCGDLSSQVVGLSDGRGKTVRRRRGSRGRPAEAVIGGGSWDRSGHTAIGTCGTEVKEYRTYSNMYAYMWVYQILNMGLDTK
jgi:hypothetical protein